MHADLVLKILKIFSIISSPIIPHTSECLEKYFKKSKICFQRSLAKKKQILVVIMKIKMEKNFQK
jgi:hypothetical protein